MNVAGEKLREFLRTRADHAIHRKRYQRASQTVYLMQPQQHDENRCSPSLFWARAFDDPNTSIASFRCQDDWTRALRRRVPSDFAGSSFFVSIGATFKSGSLSRNDTLSQMNLAQKRNCRLLPISPHSLALFAFNWQKGVSSTYARPKNKRRFTAETKYMSGISNITRINLNSKFTQSLQLE